MKAVTATSACQQSLKTFQNTPPHFAQETLPRLHHKWGIQEIIEQRSPLLQLLEVFHPETFLCLSASHQESRETHGYILPAEPMQNPTEVAADADFPWDVESSVANGKLWQFDLNGFRLFVVI